MTLGFALFAIGMAMVVSALKDQTVADILRGALGPDVPLGKANPSAPSGAGVSSTDGASLTQSKESSPRLLSYLQSVASRNFGLEITEPIGSDSGGHVADSYHKQGRAFDASGTPEQMAKFTEFLNHNFKTSLTELIHNPGGSIKNGKSVPGSFWGSLWGEHKGHVHVAI